MKILHICSIGNKPFNTAEIINKYNAGWGVETNAKNVAFAIKKAVLKEYSLDEKTKSALQLIEKNFTWNKIARRSVDFYLKLMDSRMK